MIGHLGSRVSALLDGRLSPAEEERAWEHVHLCHPCRDLVEREGWVKTRLAALSQGPATAPPSLCDSLRHGLFSAATHPYAGDPATDSSRPPTRHLVALSGGALGVAVLGVLALGAVPANAPQPDRRAPVTSLSTPGPSGAAVVQDRGAGTPVTRPGALRGKMWP